ncbi:hypothetical protein M8C21_009553, partial [Ambrosia artemisiifolia]
DCCLSCHSIMDFLSVEIIDNAIEDAKTKKETVESKMDSVMSLMREVELREKDAEKAKHERDECSLYMDELILAQQLMKETNDKVRAREVFTQKSKLATKMEELQFRVLGVLDEGDECVATIDKICKSLEKRLTSAIITKEAADKEKLEKEVALAYQKSQMEKLVKESERLEEEAKDNFWLQEFLVDRGHVINMLQEEVACKCQDVNLLKVELKDCQDENEISVTQDYLSPIVQEAIPTEGCECYKCSNVSKGAKEIMRTNKICKSRIKNSKNKDMKKWIEGQITEAVADHEEEYVF